MKKIKIYFIVLIFLFFISGCIEINPQIQVTKPYEGHFYNKNDVQNAINNITLQENESIWILSNTTLKRVLKNAR